jgi:pimeloyl-ACP methyl ester carboxylesterase
MAEPAQPMTAPPNVVASADGTRIAFEKLGSGPPLILVVGALCDRRTGLPLANLLRSDFTIYTFDRRGRGDSSDTLPYRVEREIEDLKALVHVAGGAGVSIYGHSSGAILALLAAAAGLQMARLATYEPPYAVDQAADDNNNRMTARIEQLLGEGKPEEALIFFMSTTGMPQFMIERQRQEPHWPSLVATAPTLVYELQLKAAFGSAYVPESELAKIEAPVLAMAGGASPDWLRTASETVAKSVKSGRYSELPGQNHMVAPEVIAPRLSAFRAQRAGPD